MQRRDENNDDVKVLHIHIETPGSTATEEEEEEKQDSGGGGKSVSSSDQDSHSDVGSSCSENNAEILPAKDPKDKKSGVANPDTVHRSLSTSRRLSSSSSGFSSIEGAAAGGSSSSSVPHSASLTKLQQLRERRAAFHHPTFANHFGFGRSGTGLRAKTAALEGDGVTKQEWTRTVTFGGARVDNGGAKVDARVNNNPKMNGKAVVVTKTEAVCMRKSGNEDSKTYR